MDDPRTFMFYSNGKRDPYIQKLIDFNVDKNTKEGYIQFNGYYYTEDSEFPVDIHFITQLHEDKPSRKDILPDGTIQYTFETLETSFYHVQFYKRETIMDTSVVSTIEDEDGEEMNICFFPTAEQKIYFRVLKEFDNDKAFYTGMKEFYNSY